METPHSPEAMREALMRNVANEYTINRYPDWPVFTHLNVNSQVWSMDLVETVLCFRLLMANFGTEFPRQPTTWLSFLKNTTVLVLRYRFPEWCQNEKVFQFLLDMSSRGNVVSLWSVFL